jgi:hypothetical protein
MVTTLPEIVLSARRHQTCQFPARSMCSVRAAQNGRGEWIVANERLAEGKRFV